MKKVYILRKKSNGDLFVAAHNGKTKYFELWSEANEWIKNNGLKEEFEVATVYQLED